MEGEGVVSLLVLLLVTRILILGAHICTEDLSVILIVVAQRRVPRGAGSRIEPGTERAVGRSANNVHAAQHKTAVLTERTLGVALFSHPYQKARDAYPDPHYFWKLDPDPH